MKNNQENGKVISMGKQKQAVVEDKNVCEQLATREEALRVFIENTTEYANRDTNMGNLSIAIDEKQGLVLQADVPKEIVYQMLKDAIEVLEEDVNGGEE